MISSTNQLTAMYLRYIAPIIVVSLASNDLQYLDLYNTFLWHWSVIILLIEEQESISLIESILLETSKYEYPKHQTNNLIMGLIFFVDTAH